MRDWLGDCMKVCRRCGLEKPVEAFHKASNNPDGLDNRCRECRHAYYLANREHTINRVTLRYEANAVGEKICPDCGCEVPRRGDRCESCGYIRKRQLIVLYQMANPDLSREWKRSSAKRRYAENEDYRLRSIFQASERTRNLRAASSETLDYMSVLRRDPCSYCGESAQAVDHIHPVSRGGENHWTNMTAACNRCNSSKHAREDMLTWIFGRREHFANTFSAGRPVPASLGATS